MTAEGALPSRCPSCGGTTVARASICEDCGVEVQGRFGPCPFCRLEGDERRLFELFLLSRGNLKQMERALRLSYPTVRQKVETLLERLGFPRSRAPERMEVLRRLKAGDISVTEAERLLRG